MQTVVLVVHLILALALIGVVLLQRSEGAGLLSGGGSMQRAPVSPLGKVTWGLAAAFIATSLTLTIIAARDSATGSVLDRLGTGGAEDAAPALPGEDLLPPPSADGSLVPPPAEGGELLPPRAE
jgi:preprotein translocase subunit SecG